MGKLNKQSDSDNEDRMDIEKPQIPAKRKLIKKKAEKPSTQAAEEIGASKAKTQSLATKSIRKFSKMVNLHKDPVDLTEKQNIFKKIVSDTKGEKKVSRKLRKKQRVLIKKVKILLSLGASKGTGIKIAGCCAFHPIVR